MVFRARFSLVDFSRSSLQCDSQNSPKISYSNRSPTITCGLLRGLYELLECLPCSCDILSCLGPYLLCSNAKLGCSSWAVIELNKRGTPSSLYTSMWVDGFLVSQVSLILQYPGSYCATSSLPLFFVFLIFFLILFNYDLVAFLFWGSFLTLDMLFPVDFRSSVREPFVAPSSLFLVLLLAYHAASLWLLGKLMLLLTP